MKKKKNFRNMSNSELIINNKLKIIANILNSLCEILVLMSPLLDKILSSEEVELYRRNGSFKQIQYLFVNISDQARKLIIPSINSDLLKELKN